MFRVLCVKRNKTFNVSNCYLIDKVDSLSSWHSRLAHQNMKQVKKVLTRNGIKYIEDDASKICEKCLAGKHRKPFYTSSSRAKKALELVHADVCGPMEKVSLGGARYFLLIKDDFSSFRYIYFIKFKSQVKSNIEKFIKLSK